MDREARGFVRAPCPPAGCIPRAATFEGKLPFPAVPDEGAALPVGKEVCLGGLLRRSGNYRHLQEAAGGKG